MKILRTLLNVGSVIVNMLLVMLSSRDHCHITGKYKDLAHRDCNISVKLQNSYCISQPKKF